MKIINYKLLLVILVLTVSCKKEEIDNPNINHRALNLEMKVSSYNADSEMSIDINDDGMQDFEIELELYKDSDSDLDYYAEIDYLNSGNEVLTQEINGDAYAKQLNSNDLISGGSSTWYSYASILEFERYPGTPDENYGYAGKGDILVGIRFMIGSERHYGWMKLNASSDYKSIIVKELAYEIRPNVEIKAGEK
jgi:hypothetical protein